MINTSLWSTWYHRPVDSKVGRRPPQRFVCFFCKIIRWSDKYCYTIMKDCQVTMSSHVHRVSFVLVWFRRDSITEHIRRTAKPVVTRPTMARVTLPMATGASLAQRRCPAYPRPDCRALVESPTRPSQQPTATMSLRQQPISLRLDPTNSCRTLAWHQLPLPSQVWRSLQDKPKQI